MAFQIRQSQGRADGFKLGGNGAGHVAPVEIVEPGARQVIKRVGEPRLRQTCAGAKRCAIIKEHFSKARLVLQLAQFCRDVGIEAAVTATPSRAWWMASSRRRDIGSLPPQRSALIRALRPSRKDRLPR